MCLVKNSLLNKALKMKEGAGHIVISKMPLPTRRYSKGKGPETGVCLAVAGASPVHFFSRGHAFWDHEALWETGFFLPCAILRKQQEVERHHNRTVACFRDVPQSFLLGCGLDTHDFCKNDLPSHGQS